MALATHAYGALLALDAALGIDAPDAALGTDHLGCVTTDTTTCVPTLPRDECPHCVACDEDWNAYLDTLD